MAALRYASGDEVRLGDVVDVGAGHGPQMRVVVIIPTQEAVSGFSTAEWSYLQEGIILQDGRVFGLLHLDALDNEHVLVARA